MLNDEQEKNIEAVRESSKTIKRIYEEIIKIVKKQEVKYKIECAGRPFSTRYSVIAEDEFDMKKVADILIGITTYIRTQGFEYYDSVGGLMMPYKQGVTLVYKKDTMAITITINNACPMNKHGNVVPFDVKVNIKIPDEEINKVVFG